MTLSQQEFETILADPTKVVEGGIRWEDDVDHTPARVFRTEVTTDGSYSIFVVGRYNSSSEKLSYGSILRGTGRIYGLDLGRRHKNPDGEVFENRHKNRWREGHRDKCAFDPQDITEPWSRPVEVSQQFFSEANLLHLGIMYTPGIQEELPL